MNSKVQKILLLIALMAYFASGRAADRWETLQAIHWVENPDNHTYRGAHGELGPYQFRPTTWKMHTSVPFSRAIDREASDRVAVAHYEWIKERLRSAGVAASTFNIAMAWNCGIGAVVSGRAPAVSYRYAQRVENLVEMQKRNQATGGTAVAETDSDPETARTITAADFTPRFVISEVALKIEVAGAETTKPQFSLERPENDDSADNFAQAPVVSAGVPTAAKKAESGPVVFAMTL